MNVIHGYCALSNYPSKEIKWVGVIEGNISTGVFRKKSEKALEDAKKLYKEKLKTYRKDEF